MITFKTVTRSEDDGWTSEGSKITSPENLEVVQAALEDEEPVLVRHSYYRGSRCADWYLFREYDEFLSYLKASATAGDRISAWKLFDHFDEGKAQMLIDGKCPDSNGETPTGGPY